MTLGKAGGADPAGDGKARPAAEEPAALPGVRTLRFEPRAVPAQPATVVVVLDTAWTPAPGERSPGLVSLRDVAERIMAGRDLFAEAAEHLNDWAEASGVVERLTIDGVSFWYGDRLGAWMWLVDQLLWLAIVDDLLARYLDVGTIACAPGADADLVAIVRLVAERDALVVHGGERTVAAAGDDAPDALPRADLDAPAASSTAPGSGPAAAGAAGSSSAAAAASTAPPAASAQPVRGRSLLVRLRNRIRPPERERRRRTVMERFARIEGEPDHRLLVVQAHRRQRIDTPDGPRNMNPYLGPIVDRLRSGPLDPFEVDIRSSLGDDKAWARIAGRHAARTLPNDILRLVSPDLERGPAVAIANERAAAIESAAAPLVVAGVDLGPQLAARVADRTRRMLPGRVFDLWRIRALLRRASPAGILLADEYHRQDWLAAAAAEGLRVAAVQHGVLYRWHTGYMHRTRPPELRLPGRTYVFGSWERELLTTRSVYRPDEVVVGGSPRLDLVTPVPADADAVRRELGIAPGDRMVVLSGTWGGLYRRFHYPIALAHLFSAPLERVHLVVKLHPSELDEGPYRQIIEGLAAAGGFAPPPITIVQAVDLYRLLAAADAHLGIHSTLLTEAVATGTPNLLATGLASADLLGYVAAGVAIPVADSADLAAALDVPRASAMREADREAFLQAHFEPGAASERIAADLLDWLR